MYFSEGIREIGADAFRNTGLTSVNLPDGVKEVGNRAFGFCPALKSVMIPAGVTAVEAFSSCPELEIATFKNGATMVDAACFENCTSLTEVNLPDSMEIIVHQAFMGCTSLTSITLPDSITEIGEEAFRDCTSLADVTLPDGITELQAHTFQNCSSLTSFTIPKNVEVIKNSVFDGCSSLTSLSVSPQNTTFDSRDNCNAIIKTATNELYRGFAFSTIPTSVTKIGYQAFLDCDDLVNYTVPAHVTEIGSFAFENCSNLETISIPAGVTAIGEGAFEDCVSLKSLSIPEGVTAISPRLCENCKNLSYVCFPTTLTGIGEGAFSLQFSVEDEKGDLYYFTSCISLTDVYYAGTSSDWNGINFASDNGALSVTRATIHYNSGACGDNAYYTYNLAGGGVLTIGGTGELWDFSVNNPGYYPYKDTILSVNVGEGITAIGEGAFKNLSNVGAVSLPHTLTNVKREAFNGCSALTHVYYTGSMSEWYDVSVAAYNVPLQNAQLHISDTGSCGANINYVFNAYLGTLVITGSGAMDDYDVGYAPWDDYREQIKSVSIENGITRIGAEAFVLTGITQINIPESVTSIGDRAFNACNSLTNVTIPGTVESIGVGAFIGCENLARVTLKEGVESIGDYAFAECDALTEVTVPYSVTAIGTGAFENDALLTDVYYPGEREDWYTIPGSESAELENATTHFHYGVDIETGDCHDLYDYNEYTGNRTYTFNPLKGVLTISGTGAMDDYVANSMPWREHRNDIKTVIIEDGVTNIGEYAFYDHKNLEKVVIGSGVREIGEMAFYIVPSKITDVYYRDTEANWNTVEIGADNTTLETATLHFGEHGSVNANITYSYDPYTETLTISGTGAMPDSYAPWNSLNKVFKKLVIENGITYIGEDDFWLSTNLEKVYIGCDVTSIGNSAFNNCNKLTDVYYTGTQADWNNVTVGSDNDPLTNATFHFAKTGVCGDDAVYYYFPYTGLLTIKGTGAIYDYDVNSPFDSDVEIEAVDIRSGITRVGEWAFNACASLKEISFPSTLTEIGDSAFRACNALENLMIPGTLTTLQNAAFTQCKGLKSVILFEGVTTLGNLVFDGCTAVKMVYVPSTLTSAGQYVFRGCTALKDIYLTDGLTVLGNAMFMNCTGLEEVTIPDSVTTLTARAFANCSALKTVNIGTSTTTIGNGAFGSCTALKDVNYDGTAESWYQKTIAANNNPLKNVIKHCLNGVDTANVGANVHYTLDNNTGVLTFTGTGAFYTYDPTVAPPPFYYNDAVKSVVFADGLTTIGANLLFGCQEFTEVTIPASVTSIGENNFATCPDLAVVNYPGTNEEWNAIDIDDSNYYLLMVKPKLYTGVCGDNLTYVYNESEKTLTISGTGEMRDYSSVGTGSNENPFKDFAGMKAIFIGDGVASLGTYAFDGCTTVTDIAFPRSMDEMRNGCLRDCNAIVRLYCYGSLYCDGYFRSHGYTDKIRYYGDIDGDGSITPLDYSAAVNVSLGEDSLSWAAGIAADFNRDGVIDALDCRLIKLLSQNKGMPL